MWVSIIRAETLLCFFVFYGFSCPQETTTSLLCFHPDPSSLLEGGSYLNFFVVITHFRKIWCSGPKPVVSKQMERHSSQDQNSTYSLRKKCSWQKNMRTNSVSLHSGHAWCRIPKPNASTLLTSLIIKFSQTHGLKEVSSAHGWNLATLRLILLYCWLTVWLQISLFGSVSSGT